MHTKKHQHHKHVDKDKAVAVVGRLGGGYPVPGQYWYQGFPYGGFTGVGGGHSEAAENAQSEAQEAASGMSEAGEATSNTGGDGGGNAGGAASDGGGGSGSM